MEPNFNDDDLLPDEVLAPVMGVPPSRLRKARLTGIDSPPWIKIGHLVRYRWGDYKAWIADRPRCTSTSELRVA